MLKDIKSIEKGYEPYIGGAGPELEQTKANNQHLLSLLIQNNVHAQLIPAKEYFEGKGMDYEPGETIIKISHGGDVIYVSYDRWGFCCDELIRFGVHLDQAGIEETLEAVKKWYFGNKLSSLKEIQSIENNMNVNREPIDITIPRTLDEWVKIFMSWSTNMNEIYGEPSNKGNGPDFSKARNNAEMWNESPSDWMEPFDDTIMQAWVSYDGGDPEWKHDFLMDGKKVIKSNLLENVKAIEEELEVFKKEEPSESEAWYEHEDCERCSEEAKESNIDYEPNFTWKDGTWVCDNCGGAQ